MNNRLDLVFDTKRLMPVYRFRAPQSAELVPVFVILALKRAPSVHPMTVKFSDIVANML